MLKSEVDSKVLEFSQIYDTYHREVQASLGDSCADFIAKPVIDGEYVNYLTNKSGSITELSKSNEDINRVQKKLFDYFNSCTPLKNSSLESNRKTITYLVSHLDKFFCFKTQFRWQLL